MDVFQNCLKDITSDINSLKGDNVAKKLATARDNKSDLKRLGEKLKKAVNLLQLELLQVLFLQYNKLKEILLETKGDACALPS